MTQLNQQPEHELSEQAIRANRAYRLLLVIGILIGLASSIISIRLLIERNFRDVIEPGLGVVAALIILVGAFLAKKGHVTLAITLAAVALFGLDLFLIYRLSNIGLPLTIALTLIIVLISSQTLPSQTVVWGVVLTFLTGAVLIILDMFWPFARGSVASQDLRIINITAVVLVGITLFIAIRQFPTYTLRTKLMTAAVSLVILTVLLTTVVVNDITRRNLTEQLNDQFQTVGVAQAAAVSELLGREVSVLQAFSLDSTLPSLIRGSELQYAGSEEEIWESINQVNANWIAAPAEGNGLTNRYRNNVTASILQNFQVSFPEHTDMLVTNQYGALVGMSDQSPLFDYRNEAWWQAAYNKAEGAIYIGLPEQNPDTGTVGIPIAVPVYSGVEFAGVLRATLQLSQLRELLAETGDFGESIQREMVFGNLVLHDEDEHGAAELHLQPLDVDSDTLLALQNGQSANLVDTIEGVRSLINLSPVSTFGHIPAVDVLDWSIIIYQPEQEALAVVEAQQQVSILLALAAIAIGSALAAYFAQLLTGPINRLTDTAVLISAGDLNRQAPVETQDEIGILAQTFNTMTGQLRTFIGSLEKSCGGSHPGVGY
ncbi:MAG: HAMP domain-containing protein [Anaerolineae bacterium]|nr:HAMP domain-containing protein [Anaerolineae bacterium]